jgi:hypothetical protein
LTNKDNGYIIHVLKVNIKNYMNDVDIFQEVGKPKWFYFKEVGDEIQGTYIGKSEGLDNFKNEQFIYVLKERGTGEIWNVGVRKTSNVVNDEMAKVQFGQLVGFKFEEERNSKLSPTGKSKIIRVAHRSDLVDTEWLQSQRNLGVSEKTVPSIELKDPLQTEDVPFESNPTKSSVAVAQEIAVSETHQAVRNIAIMKGLNEEDMPAAMQDNRIVQITGLPLNDSNYAQIIMKLSEYKK